MIARIASASEYAEQAMPDLLATRDAMIEQRDVIQAQLDVVVAKLSATNQAIGALSRVTSEAIGECECELLRTRSPLVAEMIDVVEVARTKRALEPIVVLHREKSGVCPHTQRQLYIETTTAPEIQRDVVLMLQARKSLEALRGAAPSDWQAAIDEIVEPIRHLL